MLGAGQYRCLEYIGRLQADEYFKNPKETHTKKKSPENPKN